MASPALSVDRNGTRFYLHPVNGADHLSITALIGRALPKPALNAWMPKVVAEYAVNNRSAWEHLAPDEAVDLLKGVPYRQRNRAGDRGTDIHEILEAVVTGRPLVDVVGEGAAGAVAAGRRFLDDFAPEVIAVEQTAFWPELGIAGTFDLVVKMPDGRVWLLDWKSSAGVYGSYAIQLAFYRWAPEWAWPDGEDRWKMAPAPTIDATGVVHLKANGTYALHELRTDDRGWTVAILEGLSSVRSFLDAENSFVGPAIRPHADGPPRLEPDVTWWLRERMRTLLAWNADAQGLLERRWPDGVDIPKADTLYTARAALALHDLLVEVEAEYGAPFSDMAPEAFKAIIIDRAKASLGAQLLATGNDQAERASLVLGRFGTRSAALSALRGAAKALGLRSPRSFDDAITNEAVVAEALSATATTNKETTA